MLETIQDLFSKKIKTENKITLFDYQESALSQVEQHLKFSNEAVLAACPSSGKTIMAIEYIKRSSSKKTLVLTHGQNVLKTMWDENLKKYLTESELSKVTYGLPQSLHRQEVSNFDLIIVDEAHEFAHADMVQKILGKNPKAKKLYLTGTPSKFIANGVPTIIIPAIDLIEKKYISDLYVGLFSTTANIKEEDRNSLDDISEKSYKKLEKSVNSDMDTLLHAMLKRLEAPDLTKNKPTVSRYAEYTNLDKWNSVFGSLDKTLIACASIKQADKVVAYLNSKNVSCISSNSETDPDTENISRFENETEIKVLVVVDRAILGYNMPGLVNVVDMTCSHNINRIYQLYARVMRKNAETPQKYFFKLAVKDEHHVTKFYMQASLCLMFHYFISKYNGKNLNGMYIPVMKVKTEKNDNAITAKTNNSKTRPASYKISDELFEVVNSAEILNNVLNNIDNPFNEYAFVQIGEIKRDLFGETVRNSDGNKEMLLQLAKSGATRPSLKTNLGQALTWYTLECSNSYDQDFTEQIKKIAPSWFINTANIKKEELLELAKSGAIKPSYKTKLGNALSQYISKSNSSYDQEFAEQIKKIAPSWFINTANLKKEELLELAKSGATKPSQKTKLGQALKTYILKSSSSYDQEFVEQIKKIAPSWFKS